MRKLSQAIVASLLTLGVASLLLAQGYQPPTQASPKDVYCSGFLSSTPLPSEVEIVMGEDAVGRIIYPQYDYVYLGKGADGGLTVGQRFQIVRPVDSPSSPEIEAFKNEHHLTREMRKPWYKKEYLGQYYQDIGQLEVRIVHPTIATALVTQACDAPNTGDILIPYQERPTPDYKPSDKFDHFAPPSGKAVGTVLPGKDFDYTMGQGDVLYAALGSNQGLKVGDYIRLFRAATGTDFEGYKGMSRGQWRRYRSMPEGVLVPLVPPDLPREVLGEALVVRVDGSTATAIITFSLREIHAGDFAEIE